MDSGSQKTDGVSAQLLFQTEKPTNHKTKSLDLFPQTVLALRGSYGVAFSCAHEPGAAALTPAGSSFPCILQCLVTPTLKNPS